MKKLFVLTILLVSLTFTSCNSHGDLYEKTDTLVKSLETTYNSYGMLGGNDHVKTADNGLYTIRPIGRLVNVKIEKSVGSDEYEDLKNDLKKHYKGNSNVNDVYICRAGTIMIDCRN